MRLFGSERIANAMEKWGAEEGEVITHGLVTKSIERAQKRVEGKQLRGAEEAARLRRRDEPAARGHLRSAPFALEGGEELKGEIWEMVEMAVTELVDEFTPDPDLRATSRGSSTVCGAVS
jgi:preprotein translocase subunit SecA